MPKPMYVWSGSAWVSVATEVESLATYATQSYASAQPGSKLIVPSSVAVGSGSASIATQGTVTFSGASSVSLNDVFSSTYSNYTIIVSSNTSDANSQILRLRLRVSGSDNSSNNYYWSGFGLGSNGATPTISSFGSNGLTSSFDTSVSNATTLNSATSKIELFNPFATDRTSFAAVMPYTDVSTGGFHRQFQGQMSVTTSYTGFSLISAAGNVTGSVSVYGLKNG